MKFEVEYNEQLCKWRFRAGREAPWSQYTRSSHLLEQLYDQVKEDQSSLVRQDYKPIAHSVKRAEGSPSVAYEISGGKVRRIAFDKAERQKQQLDELAAILELNG